MSCGSSPPWARTSELAREVERRFGGVSDAVALSGGYDMHQEIPPDLVQDLRRIPSAFTGFGTGW